MWDAYCLRGTPGCVAVVVTNTDKFAARALRIPISVEVDDLGSDLRDTRDQLNGNELKRGDNDESPRLVGAPLRSRFWRCRLLGTPYAGRTIQSTKHGPPVTDGPRSPRIFYAIAGPKSEKRAFIGELKMEDSLIREGAASLMPLTL